MPQFYIDPKTGQTRGSSSGPETDRLIQNFWNRFGNSVASRFQTGNDEKRNSVKGANVQKQQERANAIENDKPEPDSNPRPTPNYDGKKRKEESAAHERAESPAQERAEHQPGGAEYDAKGGKVQKTMHEFKHGTLHSGSKHGPKVTDRKQAVAIALSQARKAGESASPPPASGGPPGSAQGKVAYATPESPAAAPQYDGAKHPGFAAVQKKIPSEGYSKESAGAILASRTRNASASAKKKNPRLKRVKG